MAKNKVHPYKRQLSAEISIESKEPAENCFERLREVYAICKAAHAECYAALRSVHQKQALLPVEELVDCQFAMRESAALLEDLRKELNKTISVQAGITCAKWVLDPMVDTSKPIAGTHANGHPHMATRTATPHFDKDPVAYNLIMDWLNIPEDLRDHGKILYEEGEFETEIVKINWPGFQDYLSRITEMGYPLPPGIVEASTWKEALVTCRKMQDLL